MKIERWIGSRTGVLLALASLVLAVGSVMLWFSLARQVALPENRTGFVIAFASAALLGVFSLVKGARWFGALPALGAILIGCFLPFTMAISRQEVAPQGIQVGQPIPHFAQLNDRGELFDSASLAGKPVLMKFFRAHW